MTRFVLLRGLLLTGLFALGALSGLAQPTANKDKVTLRGAKGPVEGKFKVSDAGFAVAGGDKATVVNPDEIVRFKVGDLPGVERSQINKAETAEEKAPLTPKDVAEARDVYKALAKGPGLQDVSKRYLEYKVAALNQKLTDELDFEKGWKEKADEAISEWGGYLRAYKAAPGWELWPAVRGVTRLQVERGKFDEAAGNWALIKELKDMPPDARLEAALQELDFLLRAKKFSPAAVAAADPETQKLLAAAPKERSAAFAERLAIYKAAADGASNADYQKGIDAVKGLMDKSKDPAVHATGFMAMGELYLAADRPRDAMWMFLWVETVVNQDPHEAFKAVARLADLFAKAEEMKGGKKPLADDDLARKYREKLKRLRATF